MIEAAHRDKYIAQAIGVLEKNDRGSYTVPTHGLYPFQWNWDSCLSALGQAHVDETRAWIEIETLFEHQWEDGMVPHIVFHEPDEGYFPGPEIYGTNRPVPTSGITQPAVAGFVINRLFGRSQNKALAQDYAARLLPKVARWHEWFYACRDPKNTGLAAIIHPWESGRDNSVDWDTPFEKVPTDGVGEFTRRDTAHTNPEHRPTQAQYQRYIWLIQHFRSLAWDNTRLHDASPFQIVDPGFNAILIRSCQDLAHLARCMGEDRIAERNTTLAENGLAAMQNLWSEKHGQYLCQDRIQNRLIDSPSIAGLLAVFAPIKKTYAEKISTRIQELASRAKYILPSHDPATKEFDGDRYWRGPVWLIVNYMVVDGLLRTGKKETADRIIRSSLEMIDRGGLAEYYNPHSGQGCGGDHFTWTAAMVLEFLQSSDPNAAHTG